MCSFKDVERLIKAVDKIKRPDGDNEGYPINSPPVYDYLSPEDQDTVDQLILKSKEYVDFGETPNRRSINTLTRHGYPTYVNEDQGDSYRVVGGIETQNWKVDLSDPSD